MSSRIVPEAMGGDGPGGAVVGRGGNTGAPLVLTAGGGPPFRRTVEGPRESSSFIKIICHFAT